MFPWRTHRNCKPNSVMLSEHNCLLSEVHRFLAWVFHSLTGLIWEYILDIYSPPAFHFHDFLSSWLSQFTCSFRLQTLTLLSESLFAAYQPGWSVHLQEHLIGKTDGKTWSFNHQHLEPRFHIYDKKIKYRPKCTESNTRTVQNSLIQASCTF